jgi:hypothetical protein
MLLNGLVLEEEFEEILVYLKGRFPPPGQESSF